MYKKFVKRLFDLVFVLLAIIFLGWIMVLACILYAVTFQFPIFFKQERIGKNNRSFVVYKFRTLKQGDANLENRRFWLGDFLRFFSMDELPQFWNVLKGEMSLIGPRPLPTEYLALMNDEEKRRHLVLPGITGWTQVNGRHGISWERKFELDLFYVDNISMRLDSIIVIKTCILLLSFKKDVSLNEEKFKGN
ncbi:MAG: sugar transferase [Cyclobacteriaceae bacterium]